MVYKPLFVGIEDFMYTTKKGTMFLIYVLPTPNVESQQHEILFQYKDYKYMLKKKNVDTLLKHWIHDNMINFKESVQAQFESFYNLSQNELAMLWEYINGNIEKRFMQHSKSLVNFLILFLKKNDGSLWLCVDYHGLNYYHQELISFTFDIKTIGLVKSCKNVHQDWFTWNI